MAAVLPTGSLILAIFSTVQLSDHRDRETVPVEIPAPRDAVRPPSAVSTPSEYIQLKNHLFNYWKAPPVREKLSIVVQARLNLDGSLAAPPQILSQGQGPDFEKMSASAIEAVRQAQPFKMLPAARYENWKVITFTFDSEMVGQDAQVPDDIVKYDWKNAMDAEHLHSVVISTRTCIRNKQNAMLMQGLRSRQQLLNAPQLECGVTLLQYMRSKQMPRALQEAAVEDLQAWSEESLKMILQHP